MGLVWFPDLSAFWFWGWGFLDPWITQDILVSLVEEWREAVDKDNVVGALFLDMSI